MPRSKYSWETAPPNRRKGRLWRWFVLFPALAVIAAGGVGAILFLLVRAEFVQMAKQFDLARLERMESASLIYDRKGGLMGKIFIQNRDPVPYDKLPQLLVQAVVSTEDQRFWDHGGVDYLGVARAAIANWTSGRIRQGASTVTQQLARNSFDLKERTYRRKLLEIALAHRIEENLSKEKIMELYLNRVYFGGGLYGAEAAARGYFGVPASAITAGQAAMLAGLLKSPNSLSPWTNLQAAQDNRNFVLGQMRSMGFLTSAAYKQVVAEPLVVRRRPDPNKQSYAMDYVRQQAINSLGYDRAMNGGFRIYTTLDPAMQLEAEKALNRKLDDVEKRPGYANQTHEQFRQRYMGNPAKTGDANTPQPDYLQGAILALDNKTGGILVMVGGRDFFHSEYNRSVQGRRPLGTAFAPIVYAAAFEKGLFPGTVVQDWALDNRLVGLGGGAGILGEWGVETAENEFDGDVTAREALVKGANSAVVRVGFQTGLDAVAKLAREAGVDSPLRPYANSYLGSSELTLEEAVMAYTMFPGAGTRPAQSHIIQRIEEADRDVVYEYQGERKKVVADSTAWQVHSILSDVLSRGTGSVAMSDYGLAVAGAAGKTGTAYNFTDAWFLGYDEAVTCGVWVGFDRPRQIYRGAFGKDLALPIWVDVMNASRADFASSPIKTPVSVEQSEICTVSGELATEKCVEEGGTKQYHFGVLRTKNAQPVESTAYNEYVRVGYAPKNQCSVHAGGLKSYVKEFAEGEWPRAAVAVDLSKIPPINVSSSPVVGGADPYNTITPAIMGTENADAPVAEAVAAAPGEQATAAAAPAEIRKAEAAGVKDAVEFDFPQVSLPEPPPIRF